MRYGGVIISANTMAPMVPMPALTTGVGSDGNSLAQRPLYNSGTQVLSWQGPIGGGASTGSYPLQTRTLTTSSAVTTSSNGQIIEGLAITGSPPISVNHNNVTIRQNFVQIVPGNTNDTYCIFIAAGVTGTIIEDNLLDGNADANEGNCVGGDNIGTPTVTGCTMRRNNCFQAGQAIRYCLNNISFTENYCHKVAGGDADWFECYPGGSVNHQNNHLLIQYNYFTGPDNSVTGADSGINLSTGGGLPSGRIGPDVVMDSNWFVWNSTPRNGAWSAHALVNSIGGGTGGGGTEQLEYTFTNNGIYDISGTPDAFGMNVWGDHSSGNDLVAGGLAHDSNNYVMGTPTARTGNLYNGFNGPGRL